MFKMQSSLILSRLFLKLTGAVTVFKFYKSLSVYKFWKFKFAVNQKWLFFLQLTATYSHSNNFGKVQLVL